MDELEIRAACERGDTALALTRLLEWYGPELLGYLNATTTRSEARDVYSMVVEDLWRGLPKFAWRCSARVWAYTLARHARARYFIAERRRQSRDQAIPTLPWLRELIDRTRSPTPVHERSEVREGMQKLRRQLEERDQTLLMLRVDRGLSWQELAIVLDESSDEEPIATTAARLRKRFQAIKQKLRALAIAEGLLDGG